MEKLEKVEAQNPIILEKGNWKPENVIFHQILEDRTLIKVHEADQAAIESN